VSGSADNTLKVWDLGSGHCLTTFKGDSGISACAVSTEKDIILAGDKFGRACFLKLIAAVE